MNINRKTAGNRCLYYVEIIGMLVRLFAKIDVVLNCPTIPIYT